MVCFSLIHQKALVCCATAGVFLPIFIEGLLEGWFQKKSYVGFFLCLFEKFSHGFCVALPLYQIRNYIRALVVLTFDVSKQWVENIAPFFTVSAYFQAKPMSPLALGSGPLRRCILIGFCRMELSAVSGLQGS